MMGLGFYNMSSGSLVGIGILALLLVIALIAYKQNFFDRFFKDDESPKNAKFILAEKYSLGKITKEEYESKLDVLNDL